MRERSNASGRVPRRSWDPVQPYLGQKSKVIRTERVSRAVSREKVPLTGRVARQAPKKPLVEIFTGLALAAELVGVLPPAAQVTPTQTFDRDLPVMDKGAARSPTDDLDAVVHRGPETNVRFP
ncbi:hypothetical protein ABT168_35335 [Streptomyces sp. NPDC001793]|uniref:hypothetical protein n=1 Tax=Streptomyces sp. NPDC001793 TaxID=3154657 RepID=UPI00331F9491